MVYAESGVPRPQRVDAVSLAQLCRAVTDSPAPVPAGGTEHAAVRVSGITASSDRVRPGDLFAALPGRSGHGARFAAAAQAAGAVAVLTDAAGRAAVPDGVATLLADDVRAVLGQVASAVYGDPSHALSVVGVTGTSGKTTTTFLLRAAFIAAGRSNGLIGTVATMLGSEPVRTGFTTPEAPDLQALLAVMVEQGVSDVAMEVSSHALSMGRVAGTRFSVAGFTNLSEDHLDFHADMTEYFQAKAGLFTARYTERSVVVTDDVWGAQLAAGLESATTVTTGRDGTGDWRAQDITDGAGGTTTFRVSGPAAGAGLLTGCAIPGRYNVANALLAEALAVTVGIDMSLAAHAIADATVPGRMERVEAGQPFLAVVDYSHKPAAVDGALRALRPLTRGRLIVVLGCGGDRDRGKRPHMGEIAARGADLLIVTDDNPRSEDPAGIRAAVLAGARGVPRHERGDVEEVGDRAAAIALAVHQAQDGDSVLIAGKGHETGQETAGVTYPFDDREVLRAVLVAVSTP